MFCIVVLIAVLKNKRQERAAPGQSRTSNSLPEESTVSPASNAYEELRAMIEELKSENAKLKEESASLRDRRDANSPRLSETFKPPVTWLYSIDLGRTGSQSTSAPLIHESPLTTIEQLTTRTTWSSSISQSQRKYQRTTP